MSQGQHGSQYKPTEVSSKQHAVAMISGDDRDGNLMR
jgi:hypothetical protein